MKNFDSTHDKVFTNILLLFSLVFFAGSAYAQPKVQLTSVITGLNLPMQLINAGDGSNRIFIVQKEGTVLVYNQNYVSQGVFLTLTDLLTTDEHGLLSMVFHPDYQTNGLFFVYYTNLDGNLVLKRFKVSSDANIADAASGKEVLVIPHPNQPNHNGGELHFGADGYLYLSTGDGGGANDPYKNAQNSDALLGKILRIDVNTSETPPYYTNPSTNPYPAGDVPKNPVYAIGLRNPFRWSFDRQTQDMWIGDVGQGAQEEINYRSAASSTLGVNYGWPCYEGTLDRNNPDCAGITPFQAPVHTYQTGFTTGRSIVGGVVYRGSRFPAFNGYYVAADHYSGNIYIIKPSGSGAGTTVQTSTITGISDFGESENGEIYAVGLESNTVYAVTGENPLPVELISLTGTQGVETVKLTWETSMEKSFRQFDIEYSINAKSFANIGTVSSGNTDSGSLYQFSHKISYAGPKYYRLKMIDKDNSFEYSKIISVNENTASLNANFVRPSFIENRTMNVLIEEPFHSLELVGVNGNVFFKQDISNKKGNISVPLESISSGMYIVRLQGSDKILNQKILIEQ